MPRAFQFDVDPVLEKLNRILQTLGPLKLRAFSGAAPLCTRDMDSVLEEARFELLIPQINPARRCKRRTSMAGISLIFVSVLLLSGSHILSGNAGEL
jgi:hypothetical protein